jgi:hypothetical protein
MKRVVASSVVLVVACFLFAVLPTVVLGQESKSTALAKELTQLLDAKKLEAISAKDPSAPDLFVGALYYPGSQLMVVSARYLVPPILVEKIAKKEFMEVYTDLSSAGIEGSRTLVMDSLGDGLKPTKDDGRFDTCDSGTKSWVFDGEWKKQKFASEEDYRKAFADADAAYAKALTALIAQAKRL